MECKPSSIIVLADTKITSQLSSMLDDVKLLVCANEQEVQTLLANKNICSGIIFIEERDFEKRLLCMSHTVSMMPHFRWIAIIPPASHSLAKALSDRPDVVWDYFHLPLPELHFKNTIGHTLGFALSNTTELSVYRNDSTGNANHFDEGLREKIDRYAKTNCSVLIRGETGTGKTRCADQIHHISERGSQPFIVVNCGAISESLVHSELFGHEKGSFTGAINKHIGYFERAHRGTLFLDEIGDLSLAVQVHLLQFLESKKIQRVGGREWIDVECRFLFATHVDLEKAIEEGRFREDLYHRINILVLHLPPLRSLKTTRMSLAHAIVSQLSSGKKTLSLEAQEVIDKYSWPGNIRELRNRIQRACISGKSDQIEPGDLELPLFECRYKRNKRYKQPNDNQLLECLANNGGNITKTAKELSISRTTLYRMLKRRRIDYH